MELQKKQPRLYSWAAGVGLVFCLSQIGLSWIFAPKELRSSHLFYKMIVVEDWDPSPAANPLSAGYLRFNNWDSMRFFEIARNGYHIPSRPLVEDDLHHYQANVTTPPTYPFAVRAVQKILGVRFELALLLASQLACWIFWFYF